MIDQPDGVHRVRRGAERPPREYDVHVDGERAGWAERLPHGQWRFHCSADGDWRTFGRPGAFAAGAAWLAVLHRSARARNTQVAAAVTAEVRPLDPVVANPFAADPFADPLDDGIPETPRPLYRLTQVNLWQYHPRRGNMNDFDITDSDIAALEQAAANAGDAVQVRLCRAALAGNAIARAACERVILDARYAGREDEAIREHGIEEAG